MKENQIATMKNFWNSIPEKRRPLAIGMLLTIPGAVILNCIMPSPEQVTAQLAANNTQAVPISKWKNPNVKPFAESPFYSGGYTETVTWDERTQQWYCKFSDTSSTRCSDAEGKTQAQLDQEGEKARQATADFDASEAQRLREAHLYHQGQEIIKSQQAPWYTR
jgi:hypothetical protein